MGFLDSVGDFFSKGISWILGIELEPETQGSKINRRSNVAPIPIVYGTQKIMNGIRVFEDVSGTDNRYLTMAIVLCEGEIEAIDEIFLDGKPLSEFASVNVSTYGSLASWVGDDMIVVRKYLGSPTQTQDALLNTSAKWAAKTRRGQGIAYLAIRLRYSQKYFTSPPEVSAIVRGRKVYDPRSAQTVFTSNAALILRDYLTNTMFGKGLPASELGSSWTAAFNDCDATETLVSDQSFGNPDEILAIGGANYARWNSRPSNGFAMEQIDLRNAGSSKTATAGVPFLSQGFYGNPGGLYVRFDMETGADFTTGDAIFAGSTSARLLACNVTLNGGAKQETLFKNTATLLSACRGMLPRTIDKYELYVEKVTAPTFTITEDQIVRSKGVSTKQPKKTDKYNRVSVKFTNPSANWDEDLAIYPDPGSATEIALLAEDNGTELHKEFEVRTAINLYQAKEIARLILYKSRNNVRATLTATSELLNHTVGEVGTLTYTPNGWNSKEFLITAIGLSKTGEAVLELTEYSSAIYTFEAVPLDLLRDNTDLPDPFFVAVPANLTLAVVIDQQFNGGQIASIDVQFDAVDDETLKRYEIQYRKDGATEWQVWPASVDPRVFIKPVVFDLTYDVRVRAVNDFGSYSDWTPVEQVVIDKDTTAPGLATGVAVTGGAKQVTVSFTKPVDEDLRHFEVYINTSDSIPGTPIMEHVAWTSQFIISGLLDDTQYFVWLKSVDDAGNVSAATASVSGYTLAAGAQEIYTQSGTPTSTTVGALWVNPSSTPPNEVKEYNGSTWVAHIPPDPSGLALTNPNPSDLTQFLGPQARFAWDRAELGIYNYLIEIWWTPDGGSLTLQREDIIRNRGGVAAAIYQYAYTDAIEDDPDTTGDEPRIKDGARSFKVRVYTSNPDDVTRSANYQELTVTNPQHALIAGVAVEVDDRMVNVRHGVPEGGDFGGVEIHGSVSNGFTPGPSTLLRTIYNATGTEEIRSYLSASTGYYIRVGAFDNWGKDSISYSPQAYIVTPANFGGLAYYSSISTGLINNDAVTRAKVAAGDLIQAQVVNYANFLDTTPTYNESKEWTHSFTAKGNGIIICDVSLGVLLQDYESDTFLDMPNVHINLDMKIGAGAYEEIAIGTRCPLVPLEPTSGLTGELNYEGEFYLRGSTDYQYFGGTVSQGDSLTLRITAIYQNSLPGGFPAAASLYYLAPMVTIQEYNNE